MSLLRPGGEQTFTCGRKGVVPAGLAESIGCFTMAVDGFDSFWGVEGD